MANDLADFVQAQNTGYETGQKQASPNALGMFIRTMLEQRQKNLEIEQQGKIAASQDIVKSSMPTSYTYTDPATGKLSTYTATSSIPKDISQEAFNNLGLSSPNTQVGNTSSNVGGENTQLPPGISGIQSGGGKSPQFIKQSMGQMGPGKLSSIVDMTDKTPEEIQNEVKAKNPAYFSYLKAIYEGRDVAKYSRYGDQNQIHQDVNTLWPNFDASLQPARVATRKGFVAGKEAQNIRSLNTAIQHLGELDGLIPQLQNTGFRPGNTVKNFISKNTGKPAITNFNMVKNALSGELAAIFKNSGGTDIEIANISQTIDSANSPEQLKGAIQQATALMSGRMGALDSQWKGIFGQDSESPNPIMNTNSKNTLKRLGLGSYSIDNSNQINGDINNLSQNSEGFQTTPSGNKYRIIQ